MNPDSVLDYARDVVSTLGGRPASLVTEPSLQAFLAAGTALDLVTHDVEALMTAGQPIPAVLEQQWHSALAGWQQAQNDIKNRLAGYLTAGLPSLPGLDDVARRLSWDDPLGFRGTSSLGPVELTLGAPVVVRHPSFALAPVVIGPARPDLIGAKLGGALGGGGALRVLGDGIAGVLSLSLGAVEVSALASLRRMPATGDASFLAIIGVAFTPGIQLGFGFAITRAGGVIGTNRRADSAALATQLRSGTAGDVLFASDPLHEAARLLPAAEQMFPPARGAHLVGPTFQLSWLKIADATFVSFDLGVLIEFPGPSRLLLLGVARAGIPGPVPLLRLRLDLLGWIDFAQRQTGFDATLVDSGALGIFTIAGDAAFRLSYGDRPYTLLTVGGFYPGFNPEPAQLPPLRRVGLALDAPVPGVSVRVEGYFAVTTNTLQFGGSLECAFDAAGVGAAGFLALDALIQFTPFHFHAVCSAGFRVYALGLTFAGIRLDGTIDGPGPIVISGRLTVETFLHDISWHETFTLGSSGGDTRVPARRLLDALEPELGHAENLRRGGGTDPLVVLAPRAAHGTRAAISPVGTLEWRQRRAPLGIPTRVYCVRVLAVEQRNNVGVMNGCAVENCARPTMVVRFNGSEAVRTWDVPSSEYAAIGRKRSPSTSNTRARGASHRRAARSATASIRLHVARRSGEITLQDLAGRRLPFERLLCRLEQAYVVDGNCHLLRKCTHQRNLLGREQSGLAAPEQDRTVGVACPHQWYCEHGTKPEPPRVYRVRVLAVEQRNDVGVMNGCAVDNCATDDGRPPQRERSRARLGRTIERILGHGTQEVAIDEQHPCEERFAQTGRPFGDSVEHRLHVARRSGDHLQELADRGVLFQCLRGALLDLRPVESSTFRDFLGRVDLASTLVFADLAPRPIRLPPLPLPGATTAQRSTVAYATVPFRGRSACSVAGATLRGCPSGGLSKG